MHTQSDLQAVEPKWLDSRVSWLPHCGQRGAMAIDTGAAESCRPGGAMPYSWSLTRASSLIQSVVHGGDSTNSTSTCW